MKKKITMFTLDQSFREWLMQALDRDSRQFADLRTVLGEEEEMMIVIKEDLKTRHPSFIALGEIKIYPSAYKVTKRGQEINLTAKEFELLLFLIENRGEVFTKEKIYEAVWGQSYIADDSNVMSFIRKIRKKIEDDPDDPLYILTVWGIGYKFNDEL